MLTKVEKTLRRGTPRGTGRLGVLMAVAVCALALLGYGPAQSENPSPASEDDLNDGRRIFVRACSHCHGTHGQGDGPVAYFLSRDSAPRPRDFTTEEFKFRSTETGALPTDGDLFRFMTNGRPGYMPGFQSLSNEDLWNVIHYVKSLVPAFAELEVAPASISVGTPLPFSAESAMLGQAVYAKLECGACHGDGGQGDGPASKTLQTTGGLKIRATDLTRPSSFGGGSSPEDIYRTFHTGLNGVPMPSYAGLMTEEEAWNLVNFMLSLNREGF